MFYLHILYFIYYILFITFHYISNIIFVTVVCGMNENTIKKTPPRAQNKQRHLAFNMAPQCFHCGSYDTWLNSFTINKHFMSS